MKKLALLLAATVVPVTVLAQHPTVAGPVRAPYGSDRPMPVPQLFGIPQTSVAQTITFTPDGRVFYFVTEGNGRVVIKYSTFHQGRWAAPAVAGFVGDYSVETPYVSPDGSRIFYFQTGPQGGTWYAEKAATGWGRPQRAGAPFNVSNGVGGSATYISMAASRNAYFLANRTGRFAVYRSEWAGDHYGDAERLDDNVNGLDVGEPCIAPDESYLLFRSNRAGGQGDFDLYVSYRRHGTWTPAENLGPAINSSAADGRPYISPDGKYLFFSSNRDLLEKPGQPPSGRMHIYQVDIGALHLRKE